MINPITQTANSSSTLAPSTQDIRAKNMLRAQRLAQIGFWYWDPVLNIVEWDEIYSEIMGLLPEKMHMTLNQCIATVNQGDQAMIRQILDDVVAQQLNEIPDMSYRIKDNNGVEKYLRVLIDVERDEEGQILTVVGTAQDVTHQENAARKELLETQLSLNEAKEANLAKSAFLANMSHELRTPLNAIIGYGELIRDDLQEGEIDDPMMVLPDVLHIVNSAHHLLHLVNDLLDVSKIENGGITIEIQSFSARQLMDNVQEIVAPLVERNNNRFSIKQELSSDTIIGDRLRLRQVVVNLVSNALKFTRNGEVALTVQEADTDCIEFIVSDTGIGIDPKMHQDIFVPFKQIDDKLSREFDGSGLGLAICNQLMTLMNGTIKVDSELGAGATFSAILPQRLRA